MSYRVVWFKRDLRLHDHRPLVEAMRSGPVLCLYVFEPSLWRQADAAAQHLGFVQESLHDLDQQLQVMGLRLHCAVGEVVEVLARLHHEAPFEGLHAHEETGNAHTYARDKAVSGWCRRQGVHWQQWPQFGVCRPLPDRRLWKAFWETHMGAAVATVPQHAAIPATRGSDLWTWGQRRPPSAAQWGLTPWDPPQRQKGGRSRGLAVLQDFLDERCAAYRGGISSPLTATHACSRLSPYLAHGCLSMREVVQATRDRIDDLRGTPHQRRLVLGLQAFHSRLYWHCHFIQKLESEPAIEWRSMHQGYDGLREHDWNNDRFKALTEGRTGWPMVDACVAMLRETGWINFRMRAMLVSVAAYPLWLHWQPVGWWLARQFLDYEPGIHWSQMQMQSGTTGINTTRVYNPIKQAQDQDPRGVFVRRWLPAMRRVPDTWLLEPWRMGDGMLRRHGLAADTDIHTPLVDLAPAIREAKTRLHQLRQSPAVRAGKAAVIDRHGSRLIPPTGARPSRPTPPTQMQLGF